MFKVKEIKNETLRDGSCFKFVNIKLMELTKIKIKTIR